MKRWQGYLVSFLVGAAIAVSVTYVRGFDAANAFALNAASLSDGCFVAGLLLTGIGALVWISTTGFFDIFSYGVKSLLVLFSSLGNPKKHQKFFDYKTERAEKRGKTNFTLLLTGVGFLAVSMVFLAMYYA